MGPHRVPALYRHIQQALDSWVYSKLSVQPLGSVLELSQPGFKAAFSIYLLSCARQNKKRVKMSIYVSFLSHVITCHDILSLYMTSSKCSS